MSEFPHLIKQDSISVMLAYYLLLCICIPPHRTSSGIKIKYSDNSSTVNYESIRATALLKYTQAAGAIWGCVKTTTKTNPFIQLWMYSPALPMFLLRCRLSSIGFKFPKSILGLRISPFIDRGRIGKQLSTDLQCWVLLLLTRRRRSEHSGFHLAGCHCSGLCFG